MQVRSGEDADRVAGDPGGDVLDGLAVEDLVGVAGDVAQVRGEHGARRRPQGVVGRQRLLVEDVEAGTADGAVVQGVEQRLLRRRSVRGWC